MTIGLATRSIGSFGGSSIPNLTPVTIGNLTWTALNANTAGAIPYSILNNTAQTRFEVINGQNAVVPGFSDPTSVIRSEVYSPKTFPSHFLKILSFGLLVRSGPIYPSPLAFLIFGQIHCDDNIVGSPCFSFNLLPDGAGGEKLVFDRNYNSGTGNVFANIGSIPFSRNTFYALQVEIIDSNGASNGFLRVTVNGTVVATFSGPVGYVNAAPNSSYPKFGIYGGGNGGNATATPLPGQNIVAFYTNVQFTDGPAFYQSAAGSDSNPGTQSQPFLTFTKSAAAMNASATTPPTHLTYLLDTGGPFTAATWATGSFAWKAAPSQSPIVNLTTSLSGGTNLSTYLDGITINGSANDGNSVFQFNSPTFLTLWNCPITVSANQGCLVVFNANNTAIQGNTFTAPTSNSTNLVSFPMTDSQPHNNVTIATNHFDGCGRFQLEHQFQNNELATNHHWDRNTHVNFTSFGSVSVVGALNASNANNTYYGNNISLPSNTTIAAGGVEFSVANCTFQANVISYCAFATSISACPGAAFLANTIRMSTTFQPGGFGAFTPGGSYNSTEWIGANTIIGASSNSVTGCVPGSTGFCTLGHGAYGAQPTLYRPSPPFIP